MKALKVTSSRAKRPGQVGDDERIAQIRLVRAVFQHRVGVADAREDRRHLAALGELVEDAADDGLERRPDVLLGDEAHLDVELVELAGQPVGARILVAEARRDLEVAVEARNHDQLLVLLRRLRQGVEAGPGGGARGRENPLRLRGLEAVRMGVWNSKKPPSFMRGADRFDHRRAGHDVAVQLVAAKVEEAVGEARLLRVLLLAENRQRQLGCGPEHLHLGRVDLDRTRWQIGVFGSGGRRRTVPSTRTTHSERTVSASPKAGESGSITTWVRP